jgi:protein-disulfide isomerase/uncharacterized membrane protein YphA (DoxX/SURF4 family)
VLAVVFGWAAWSKIGDPRTFVQAVRAYDATPEWLSKAIGYGLPVLELAVALLLLVGLITRYTAVVVAFLLVVFTIGVVQVAGRGIKIECGCFGGGGQTTTTAYTLDVLRDLGLLVLAAFLILWPITRLSLDQRIIESELVPGLTPKQLRSEKNARRYRAAVAAAEVELRHKQRYIGAGTVAVVVLVSLIAIGVQGGRAKITGVVDSTNATAAKGVTVGNTKAPVIVDLYEDLQCPICNNLEQSGLTKDIDAKIAATTIKVNYHVESFLDAASNGNKYSSRAANASYCASDVSADAFRKFHNIVYGKDSSGQNNQPAESSGGRPDSTLIEWGKQAGITNATFSTCVTSDQHAALVAAVTDQASKNGVTGTPSIFVDGKQVGGGSSVPTVASIDAAITAALAKAKSTAAPSAAPAVSGSAGSSGAGLPSGAGPSSAAGFSGPAASPGSGASVSPTSVSGASGGVGTAPAGSVATAPSVGGSK